MVANLNEINFNKMFECIKVLIEHQANVNVPNSRGMTPILVLAKNKNISKDEKREIIEFMLATTQVDLDEQRKGEARRVLTNTFPDLELPSQKSTDEILNFTTLMEKLRDEEEFEFLDGFTRYESTADESKLNSLYCEKYLDKTLLSVASEMGMVGAVEKLLRSGADANNYRVHGSKDSSPIEIACVRGNWKVLKLLLGHPQIDISQSPPLLISVIKNIGTDTSHRCNYKKCFDLLLNHRSIDINQKDEFANTALHCAVKYNNKAIILALLERGAYVGTKNKFREIPITDIDPKVLETHFNNCVTTNDRRSGDNKYEIRFNYANLVPAGCVPSTISTTTTKCTKKFPTKPRHYDEMIPIEYMAQSNDLRHLVKHPLVASFLYLKWHRLSLIFYTNFICYSFYCLSILAYLMFCYGQDVSKSLSGFLYCATAIGGLYVLLREISQFVMAPKEYLCNKENYIEVLLIIMTGIVLCSGQKTESFHRTVAAFTILLAVGEYFFLIGSLPILSFSTHVVMLKTVSKSFLKGLLLYSIILIAFALCFYTLLSDERASKNSTDGQNNTDTTAEEEDDDEFNRFGYPGVAIIKTVVMLTGEFDASSINFKNNVWSYFIFVIFVFLISTVLFNLLNGLAVSDTQVRIFF